MSLDSDYELNFERVKLDEHNAENKFTAKLDKGQFLALVKSEVDAEKKKRHVTLQIMEDKSAPGGVCEAALVHHDTDNELVIDVSLLDKEGKKVDGQDNLKL